MTKAEYHKKYQKIRKLHGLCNTGCGRPREQDRASCSPCLVKAKTNSKARVERLKQMGLCTSCSEPAAPDRLKCIKCLELDKQRRDRRKANGLCNGCTAVLPHDTTTIYCDRCKENVKKKKLERERQSICNLACGRPVEEGKKKCKKCLIMACYNRSKYLAKIGDFAPITMSLSAFINWYEQKELELNGTCEWCKEAFGAKGPAADHDHATGEIRALICGKCNITEGMGRARIEAVLAAIIRWEARDVISSSS